MKQEIILHPNRDFLNARNPSSPFQYMIAMCLQRWRRIEKNAFHAYGWKGWFMIVNKKMIRGKTKQELFNKLTD